MTSFSVQHGTSPIVLGQPHGGTWLPEEIAAKLNDNGRALADTDWHINRLYDGLLPNATVVQSHVHRYAIDANRDPEGRSLYPGQNTTTLVPLTDFDGAEIWDTPPTESDTDVRCVMYHAPYHKALQQELERVKAKHGIAVLFDCHSIRSDIPFLFEGTLPLFNTGTDNGATCAPEIEALVHEIASGSGETAVLNGRFKGGWTTRHYGRPETGIHAIQMELAQRGYMQEAAPWIYDETKAAQLRAHLKQMLEGLETLALSGALQGSPS